MSILQYLMGVKAFAFCKLKKHFTTEKAGLLMFVSLLVHLFLRQVSMKPRLAWNSFYDLGLLILLCLPPEYWNYQGASQCLICREQDFLHARHTTDFIWPSSSQPFNLGSNVTSSG